MLRQGPDRRSTALLAFLLLSSSLMAARPQVVNLQSGDVLMTELAESWRSHAGDDSKWADPAFDDSAWSIVTADKLGLAPGGRAGEFAWYRTRLTLAGRTSGLGFEMPSINASYEVFVNGVRIGGLGRLPPKPHFESGPNQLYVIPTKASWRDGSFNIAIRVWYFGSVNAPIGSPRISPRIGELAYLSRQQRLEMHDGFWAAGVSILQVPLELLGALAGFLLFALSRSDREYLWYGTFQLIGASCDAAMVYILAGARYPTYVFYLFSLFGNCLYYFFVLLFLLSLLNSLRGWMSRIALAAAIVRMIAYPLSLVEPISTVCNLIGDLASVVFTVCVVSFLAAGVWRRNRDAQFLVIAFSLQLLDSIADIIVNWAGRLGAKHIVDIASPLYLEFQWPFPFDFSGATQVFVVVSSMVLLIFRFVRVREVNRGIAAEMEAARVVQGVLVPTEIPDVAGYAVSAVYRPAGEVGGDFFQVLPMSEGGTLIVIGDVSGKGMPAAMAVSLLVGTVRTLAHYTQSPAEILTAMNQRMLARSKDGFTTCLVLRIDANGAATLANAGHLAPYLGAQELPVESDLPLGLSADSVYTESSFHLKTGQELTLLTDGVAEARARTGELFGFERTASICTLSADHIAATAQAFGQQDDITILKIRRCPVPDPEGVPLATAPSTYAA